MTETIPTIHDELNDFLPISRREKAMVCTFNGNPSVKHLIECQGIPHPEVGQIFVNNNSVDFDCKIHSGDSIEVFPASPQLDRLSGLYSGGNLTIQPGFILDNHLGKLATYLRILGFDANYRNDFQDDELAKLTSIADRILLTRDRRLLMRKTIRFGYWVRSLEPESQLIEIIRRFGLKEFIAPFRRCLRCNTSLRSVSKEVIIHRLEPLTIRYFEDFRICPICDQIYWKGSHYDRMVKLIDRVVAKC